MRCSALDTDRACASVLATMNLGPAKLAASILLTALPPPPPTPITTMRGFISSRLGVFPVMTSPSEAFPQPLSHAPQIAAPGRARTPVPTQAGGGVEGGANEANSGRERGTAACLWQI